MGKHIVETKYDLDDIVTRQGERGRVVRIDFTIDGLGSGTDPFHVCYHVDVETPSGNVIKIIQEAEFS